MFSKEELEAAKDKIVPDLIAPDLKLLLCGINPGLYTAASGWHFGRPGNRFWAALHEASITDTLLHPSDQEQLLELGIGVTNLVPRTSVRADGLTRAELEKGGQMLLEKVELYKPKAVGILGISAYRIAFNDNKAKMGLQDKALADADLWLLPNPSGLNAAYNKGQIAQMLNDVWQSVK